jgi:hypothetical protein
MLIPAPAATTTPARSIKMHHWGLALVVHFQKFTFEV